MNEIKNYDSLKESIQKQEKHITDLESSIEKIRYTKKYKLEHLQRLEKKKESVFQEKQHITNKNIELSKESHFLANQKITPSKMQSEDPDTVLFT